MSQQCKIAGSRSIVVACFLIQAVGIGTFVTFGVFFDFLADELGWSRAVISGASSCAFLLSGLFAVLVGRLSDKYGPRTLMAVAALFFGFGYMLMSQVYAVWQLYLFYGVIFGVGLSAIDVIPLTTTARWFTASRGFITGIVKVGTGAGQFLIPFLASLLIAGFGWRSACVVIGTGALVLLFTLAILLKPYPDPLIVSQNNSGDAVEEPSASLVNLSIKEAIKTNQMWILCGSYMLLVCCLLTVIVHIVPHATDIGLTHTRAAGVLSTIGAVSMVGRFISGVVIDKSGSKCIMISCFVILLISLFCLQIADSQLMLYIFGGIYGLAHGGFFTAISPIVAEVFGISSHGGIFGVVVFTGTVGGSIGPVMAGMMFDVFASYDQVFLMITIMGCLSFGLMLLLKPIQQKGGETGV